VKNRRLRTEHACYRQTNLPQHIASDYILTLAKSEITLLRYVRKHLGKFGGPHSPSRRRRTTPLAKGTP